MTRICEPTQVWSTPTILPTYEFTLHPSNGMGRVVYLEAHPLLTDKYGDIYTIRLPGYDVEETKILCNGIVIQSIVNYDRDGPGPVYMGVVLPTYQIPIMIPHGLVGTIQIQMTFWRKPITPFWIRDEA